MNQYLLLNASKKQKGAATIFTSIMLLIAITIVAMLSGKTVLNETKIAANNYRTIQATAAANYAMDLGVNYFDTGGFDRYTTATDAAPSDEEVDLKGDIDLDGNVDDVFNALGLTSTDGAQTISAQLSFDNTAGTRCVPAGSTVNMKKGMITAIGFSDDGLATRTITQCVGPIALLTDDGPRQPLVAQGNVALTGMPVLLTVSQIQPYGLAEAFLSVVHQLWKPISKTPPLVF